MPIEFSYPITRDQVVNEITNTTEYVTNVTSNEEFVTQLVNNNTFVNNLANDSAFLTTLAGTLEVGGPSPMTIPNTELADGQRIATRIAVPNGDTYRIYQAGLQTTANTSATGLDLWAYNEDTDVKTQLATGKAEGSPDTAIYEVTGPVDVAIVIENDSGATQQASAWWTHELEDGEPTAVTWYDFESAAQREASQWNNQNANPITYSNTVAYDGSYSMVVEDGYINQDMPVSNPQEVKVWMQEEGVIPDHAAVSLWSSGQVNWATSIRMSKFGQNYFEYWDGAGWQEFPTRLNWDYDTWYGVEAANIDPDAQTLTWRVYDANDTLLREATGVSFYEATQVENLDLGTSINGGAKIFFDGISYLP